MSSQIISLLREQRALQSVVQQLESVQRTSIRIVPTVSGSPQALPLGCSRLGGRPDLPKGLPWPLSKLELPSWLAPSALNIPVDSHGFFTLPFVAQIRMDDLMPYDSDRLLPAAGIIYFFYAGSDYDSESDNASYWRVLWIEETNELENAAPPVPLLESALYRSCTVSFQNETTLPHVETCWIGAQKNEHAKIVLNREQWHAYADSL